MMFVCIMHILYYTATRVQINLIITRRCFSMKRISMFFAIMIFAASMFLVCGPGPNGEGDNGEMDEAKSREMVDVDGGTYSQEGAYHNQTGTSKFNHTISNFSIGKYEVTYDLWYTVREWATEKGYKIAYGREGYDGKDGESPTESKYEPVTRIVFADAVVWCNAYSEKEGYSPVYYIDGEIAKDSVTNPETVCASVEAHWDANGYRLPTEGEWQYAASDRGNTAWDHASGAAAASTDKNATDEVAWYKNNAGEGTPDEGTHRVGLKRPNSLGIYDMSGNVNEHCWDWLTNYPGSDQTDYKGAVTGFSRGVRGGSYFTPSFTVAVGYRNSCPPFFRDFSIGMRVARNR